MKDYIPSNERLILDFFHEIECPFCRRVRINIIDKLRMKHLVVVNMVDVDANTGSVEMGWYRDFCRRMESEPTPLLRLHDKYLDHSSWDYVFLMWRKKPKTLTEEVLSSEEFLEKQLYDRIREFQGLLVFPVQPSFELDRDMFFIVRNGLRLDAREYSYSFMRPEWW